MDIDIDVNQLSAETRELLLRFQVSKLHHITYEDFCDLPGEDEWIAEFYAVRKAFADCPERQIAEAGRKFNNAGEEFDQECDESKRLLTPDDYEPWFKTRLTERADEITELENAIYRLSLRVGDRRPEFWRIVN